MKWEIFKLTDYTFWMNKKKGIYYYDLGCLFNWLLFNVQASNVEICTDLLDDAACQVVVLISGNDEVDLENESMIDWHKLLDK